MRGVTVWVTNAAVWVTGKVGDLIDATASPDVTAEWFRRPVPLDARRRRGARPADAPARRDSGAHTSGRSGSCFGPRSATCRWPSSSPGPRSSAPTSSSRSPTTYPRWSPRASATARTTSSSRSARRTAARSRTTRPRRCRSSASSWARSSSRSEPSSSGSRWSSATRRSTSRVFFLPLTFIAMIWPATSRYARRLVEFLIAVILAKFVIVAIIGLASAATHERGHQRGRGQVFERMIAGAALLVLAAWSPFALLRLIPMMEIAAASVVSSAPRCRGAAQSAGISQPGLVHAAGDGSPLAGVSLARPRRPRPARPTAAASRAQTDSGLARRSRRTRREPSRANARPSRSGATSGAPSGTTYAPPRPSTSTERTPRREHPPPSPPRQTPPPRATERRAPTGRGALTDGGGRSPLSLRTARAARARRLATPRAGRSSSRRSLTAGVILMRAAAGRRVRPRARARPRGTLFLLLADRGQGRRGVASGCRPIRS